MRREIRFTVRKTRSCPRALIVTGLAVFCLLSSSVPSLSRPPAQPNGPVVPSRGNTGSATGLVFAVIPWTAYAAAAAVIFGGAALFMIVTLRREAKARSMLMGLDEINLLAAHAEALAVLYERYRQRFRVQHSLWDALAADERKHCRWIGEFTERIRRGEGSLRRELFPYGRVSNALGQVRQFTRDAAHPDLVEAMALRNALLQEKERAEWGLQGLFAISSGKFGTVLELFDSEAQAHRRVLSEAIEGG